MQIAKYTNGDFVFTIMDDGTFTREWDCENPSVDFPTSIDVKITNYCDMGCEFCHESSTEEGKHANLLTLAATLAELPAGVELAIGGGNPLSHPHLKPFLALAKSRGLICNITVNQGHLKPYFSLLESLISEDLIKGVGISISNNNFTYVKKLKALSTNVVYHLIVGVNHISIIDKLLELGNCKVLVLGYKQFGFGIQYFSEDVQTIQKEWYSKIKKYLTKCTISFDNLAIEQLDIQKHLTYEAWKTFYMGDDFCFTMYIDAVKECYAPTSRSLERVPFSEFKLLDYFKSFKNVYIQ